MKLIPIKQLTLEDLARIKASIKEKLIREVSARLAIPREQVVVRDLLPKTDMGLTTEVWITPTLAANAWTKYFDKELPNRRFVAFYGVANNAADPIATGVYLKLGPTGATARAVWEIEELYADEIPVGVTDEIILYRGGEHIFVEVYAKAAGTEPLVLLGMVGEPYGELVSG